MRLLDRALWAVFAAISSGLLYWALREPGFLVFLLKALIALAFCFGVGTLLGNWIERRGTEAEPEHEHAEEVATSAHSGWHEIVERPAEKPVRRVELWTARRPLLPPGR